MSALRNAVQRRNHKERSQPQDRQKWGLLEKRKDYQLRATDHKVKKRKIKALQEKADERNEDEFYFAMVNAQSKGGVRVAKRAEGNSGGTKALNADVVKLMKTQDAAYLRTMLQQTKREREKVAEDVITANVGVPSAVKDTGRRRLFGDDEEDITPVVHSTHSPILSEQESGSEDEKEMQPADRLLAAKRRKLRRLEEREQDLSTALQEVEQQQARMAGTVGGMNKNGVKFKVRQRKR